MTNDERVEAVVQAIRAHYIGSLPHSPTVRGAAKAAILATLQSLRVPTTEMLAASRAVPGRDLYWPTEDEDTVLFAAMIDAAIKEIAR